MLSDFFDKTFLIRCNDCGFRYRVLQAAAAQSLCPCCGAEQPPKVIEPAAASEKPAAEKAVRPIVSKSENIIEKNNEQRWGILFVSVCLQWVIILLSPLYIYYQLQEQKPEKNKEKNKETAAKNITGETTPALYIPAQVNPPILQQKAAVPDKTASDKTMPLPQPESNGSVKINSVEDSPFKDNPVKDSPVDEIAVTPENQQKAAPKPKQATEQQITEPQKFESAFSAPLPPVPFPVVSLSATGNNFKTENNRTIKPDIQNSVKKVDSKESVSQYKAKLSAAEKKLDEVSSLIAIAPESALEKGIEAVQQFRQLGQDVPSSAYWLISQAFASQGWGNTLAEYTLPITSMNISSDSRWLLSQNEEHGVVIWDILRQNPQAGSAVDTGGIPFVKLLFTPDNRFIAGGTEDGTISIWDTAAKKQTESVKLLKTDIRQLTDLQISPNGKWLACCGNESAEEQNKNAVYLWNIGQLPEGIIPQFILLRGHEKPIRTMVFSPDSGSLVTGSEDAAARVYDLKAAFPGACQAVLKGHKDGITAAAVAPNGKWIATGSRDQTIRLWSLAEGTYEPVSVVLSGHIGWISALVIDRNSDRLISGSYDRTIRLWNIPRGDIRKADIESVGIPNDQGTINKLFLSKDSRILVSLGSDASLRLLELNRSAAEELQPKNTLMLRNKMLPIQQAMLTPDNRYLIFSYQNLNNKQNSGIRIWSLQLDDLLKDIN